MIYTKIFLDSELIHIKLQNEIGTAQIPTDPKNSDYKQYLYWLNEATQAERDAAGVTLAPDENL